MSQTHHRRAVSNARYRSFFLNERGYMRPVPGFSAMFGPLVVEHFTQVAGLGVGGIAATFAAAMAHRAMHPKLAAQGVDEKAGGVAIRKRQAVVYAAVLGASVLFYHLANKPAATPPVRTQQFTEMTLPKARI